MPRTYFLETLGCPKNLVDSEGMARLLTRTGHAGTSMPECADVLVVNTCGFIEAARAESLAALQEFAHRKHPGQLLIAAGCLSQLWGSSLADSVSGLDGILGTRCWMDILRLLDRLQQVEQRPVVICQPLDSMEEPLLCAPRVAVQGPSAYLKIADGCNAPCAFCTIPAIKGPARSRPWAEVVADAEGLVHQGVREIILIAQDTTAYGWDRGERDGLPALMEHLADAVPHLCWLRLLYTYPQHISRRLIEVMAAHRQVCHYLDLPLQHAHPEVLRRMRRPADVEAVRRLIAELRFAMPDLALRTSFIVGYPGETEREFQALLDFMREIEFDRVGVFTYSQEEGTLAAELPGQLPQTVKEERYARVMELQQRISFARNQEMIGRSLQVLIEGCNAGLSVGRSYRDAPEIDGLILIESELPVGEMVPVRISKALQYDLVGVVEAPIRPL